MLTVLTVTKRNKWFLKAAEYLFNQSLKGFKWVIVYEPNVDTVDCDGLDIHWVQAPIKTRHSNLNASLNEGLRHCDGDVVVFYQDFINIAPNTLQELYSRCTSLNAFITTATRNPDGNFDARYTGTGTIREIEPEEWEANVAAAPMKAMLDLGGFEEELDEGWSWDNVNVAQRALMLGYDFYIDESIQPELMFHVKEPDLDKTLEPNYMRNEIIIRETSIGKRPIKLKYI